MVKDVREWDIGKPAHPDEMIFTDETDFNKKKEDVEPNSRARRDRDRDRDVRDRDNRKKRSDLDDDEPRCEYSGNIRS